MFGAAMLDRDRLLYIIYRAGVELRDRCSCDLYMSGSVAAGYTHYISSRLARHGAADEIEYCHDTPAWISGTATAAVALCMQLPGPTQIIFEIVVRFCPQRRRFSRHW